MRRLALIFPFLLTGCGAIADMAAPAYEPETIRIYDQAQYQADVNECRAAGAAYKPHFSLGGAVTRTLDGASSNSSLIPLSPLVPAYGAAGGAAAAVNDGLDLASRAHANVFRNCLHDETARDRSAVIADPRD